MQRITCAGGWLSTSASRVVSFAGGGVTAGVAREDDRSSTDRSESESEDEESLRERLAMSETW